MIIIGLHGGNRGKNYFADYYTYDTFNKNKLRYNIKKVTVEGKYDIPVIPSPR